MNGPPLVVNDEIFAGVGTIVHPDAHQSITSVTLVTLRTRTEKQFPG